MKLYQTEIYAIDPNDRTLKVFTGPVVPGRSLSEAMTYCKNNGLNYCKVTREYKEKKLINQIKQVTQ